LLMKKLNTQVITTAVRCWQRSVCRNKDERLFDWLVACLGLNRVMEAGELLAFKHTQRRRRSLVSLASRSTSGAPKIQVVVVGVVKTWKQFGWLGVCAN
jgi:hypothetical protein